MMLEYSQCKAMKEGTKSPKTLWRDLAITNKATLELETWNDFGSTTFMNMLLWCNKKIKNDTNKYKIKQVLL